MLHGVTINGTDTLAAYGLILLADVGIDPPERKTNYVDIPGADGSLDLSNFPQGRPTFASRNVTFNLFKAVDDEELRSLRSTLMSAYHGKEVTLLLPDDAGETTRHAYKGVLSVGPFAGYNTGIIPCTMVADPYRYKTAVTTVTEEISGETEIELLNELMPAVPTITVDADVSIETAGKTVTVPEMIKLLR